ncbi:hypothetical protein MKW92_011419 [Papaver armeniacum]|nr:hypothetical protein MKW92_011419 [Papaver armeniacum]
MNKFNKRKRAHGLKKNQGSDENTSKKKSRGNGNTSSSFNSGDVNVNLDDDIVYEILSRLPVKSLMRFKCVSKHWCSVIQKDRHFIDLHLNKSKARTNLFLTVPRERNGFRDRIGRKRPSSPNEDLFPLRFFLATAELLCEGGEVPTVVHTTTREMDMGSYSISKPVNGLICLFDPEENHGVRVCNLTTREITTWIKSTFISNLKVKDKKFLRFMKCNFGFDPATKEHKVISIWAIRSRRVCEVLTLGDRTWRIIDNVLPADKFTYLHTYGDSLYVNGSIYYNRRMSILEDGEHVFIVAFDVGKEKFRAIEIPDFILDQINFSGQFSNAQLLEIDGHPALSSGISNDIFKLCSFDDDVNNNGCRTNTWTAVTVELPINLVYPNGDRVESEGRVRFHSVTGTDFIIIYLYRWNRIQLGYDCAPQVATYSYNWRTKIFAEIKINGLPSPGPHLKFVPFISTFVESLLPVQ